SVARVPFGAGRLVQAERVLPLDVRKTGEALVRNERLRFGEREVRRYQDHQPLPVLERQAACGTLQPDTGDGDPDPDVLTRLLRVFDVIAADRPGCLGLDGAELLERVLLRVRHCPNPTRAWGGSAEPRAAATASERSRAEVDLSATTAAP